jgi:hypothetical protein
MKKVLVCIMTVILLTFMAFNSFAASNAKITAAYGTITVDGKVEDAWLTAEQQDVILVDKEVIPSETKTTGKLRTMWDEKYLYVLVEVDKHGVAVTTGGGSENTDDCAELGLTMNGDFTGSSNISGDVKYAGCIRILADGTKGGFGNLYNAVVNDYLGSMVVTGTTYTVEYAIPWQDIVPAAGNIVSMEVQINDNSAGTARDGLVNWASTPCYGWRDSLEHGAVVLGAIPVAAPAETEAQATEETTDVSAPATSDTVTAAVVMLVLSCAAVIAKKAAKR